MPRPRAYWIRLDDGVHDHPKTIGLSTSLTISREQAVGHLTRFWLWCMRYRPGGVLTGVNDAVLAEAAGWKGDPDEWCAALRANRFLTRHRHGSQAHGYAERNGYQIREAARNRAKPSIESRTNPAGYPHESRTNPAPPDVQDVPGRHPEKKRTAPPAGAVAFRTYAAETWAALRGEKPPWGRSEAIALQNCLTNHFAGDLDRAKRAWDRYLQEPGQFFEGHSPKKFAGDPGRWIGQPPKRRKIDGQEKAVCQDCGLDDLPILPSGRCKGCEEARAKRAMA